MINQQAVLDLAKKYLPIFNMHADEPFGPMQVQEFLSACKLYKDSNTEDWLGNADLQLDEGAVTPEALHRFNSAFLAQAKALFLDYAGWGDSEEECNPSRALQKYGDIKARDTFTIYAYVADGRYLFSGSTLVGRANEWFLQGFIDGQTRDDIVNELTALYRNYIVLSYVPFYCMQDHQRFNGWDDHESDWEGGGISIVFEYTSKPQETCTPKYAHFKRHGIKISSDEDFLAWDQQTAAAGGIGCVEKQGDTPVAYIAVGGHATYPASGYYSRNELPDALKALIVAGGPVVWALAALVGWLIGADPFSYSDDDDATGEGVVIGGQNGKPWSLNDLAVADRINNTPTPTWWDGYYGRWGVKVKETSLEHNTSGKPLGGSDSNTCREAIDDTVYFAIQQNPNLAKKFANTIQAINERLARQMGHAGQF